MVLVFAESLVSNHMLDLSFLRKLGKTPKLIDDRNTDLQRTLRLPSGILTAGTYLLCENGSHILSLDLAPKEFSQTQAVSPSKAQPFYFRYHTIILP